MNKDTCNRILVNQVGYPLREKKIAVFTGYQGNFDVVNEETGAIVYQGATGDTVSDPISGKDVSHGDFSSVEQVGRYRIIAGELVSHVFEVNEHTYRDLQDSLLKAFYFYRCGVDLVEEYAGPWAHKACHLTDGIVYTDPTQTIDCCGGWHDAGDYGKYTVPGAKAIADLLLAFELHPHAFENSVGIPETDLVTPDVLHESRFELEWLLKMQDQATGGVYHKITTLEFPGLDVMPEDDLDDLYISPISATATGCFSAVMAQAARIYQAYDERFADTCLVAAKRGWEWLEEHSEMAGFQNPTDIKTGEYGDNVDLDERYWAASELYRTTGNEQYHQAFLELVEKSFSKLELGWADVGGYGTISYLLNKEQKVDREVYNRLQEELVLGANTLVEKGNRDGFLLSLTENDYIWGSNMLVMNHGMLLLIASHVCGDTRYVSTALDHLHYLLGRNPLNTSYVTGFGEKTIKHPHHRPSVGDNVPDPVPGLVVGGPNRGLQDEYVKEHLQGLPPAQCFVDHEDSYSTNEVTIYWNSPAVFVVSYWVNRSKH